MINRAKMPRQLRDKGGIASVTPRKKYGLGSKLKERFRKLVPNELADIAVKAAPFVAPFNPGIAGLMRGIGRFDQRGSISDAFKQGVGTFAAGQLFRQIGGAGTQKSFLGTPGDRFTSPLSADRTTAIKDFFNPQEKLGSTYDEAGLEVAKPTKGTTAKTVAGGPEFVTKTTKATIDKIPIINKLPEFAKSQILVGGATGAITYVYEAFLKEEPPQEEGETTEEYMARRKENVGRKMRSYFDNYFKFDKDYSAMTDEQKDAFIARVNVAKGGMPTGIMRTNKAGVMERDYRDKGGFVPVGIKEKADDVPAMLSKNEFVFTADAVRGAGNGSIEKGAQRMYDTMKKLEKRVV
tara:strand:- start:1867 stop:2919 length:1053 start_codon:yes stop_codon:yes gene_type:complete